MIFCTPIVPALHLKKRGLLQKTFLVMKLTIFFITLACFQVSAASYGQNISLNKVNAPLEKVLKEINRQSGYIFWYENKVLANAPKVSVSVSNASLEQVLNACFRGQHLSYEIVGTTVVVKETAVPAGIVKTELKQVQVSGKVTDNEGVPLPGVSILIKGSSGGAITNANGEFRMQVPDESAVLIFRFVGFITQEVAVGSKTTLNVVLVPDTKQLSAVTVTAMGIRKDKRSLGYSAQEVKAEAIGASHQPNIVNALQGQAAGLQINSGGGAPGSGAKIILRGINSLDPNRDFQPLFVVDGVPIDNSTDVTDGSSFLNGSNRAADINPDDIESINVLKGGAATALYGLRAATGAIIITTKTGKAGKLRGSFTTTGSIDEINKYPETQNKYSQGWLGVYDASSFWPAFGPTIEEAKALDPTHPDGMYNNFKRGYETGNSVRNSLNISGGSEKAIFTGSFSQFNQDGIMPFTDYKNYSAKAGGEFKFSDKFRLGSSVNYIKSGGRRGDAGRYNEKLTYFSGRWDIWDYTKPDGTQNTIVGSTNDNPIYVLANTNYKDDVDRVISNTNFTYSPVKWLDINYRFGVDLYNDFRRQTTPGPLGTPDEIYPAGDFGYGTVNEYNARNTVLNSTFMLNLKNNIGKRVTSSFKVGHDMYSTRRTTSYVQGDTLVVPTFYNLSNVKRVIASNNERDYRIVGVFADWTLSLDSYLYVTFTGRNDWTSTLSKENRSFFYPSASVSWIFTENMQKPAWLSTGKLRFSAAKIGKDAAVYATSSGYNINNPLNNGVLPFSISKQTGDKNLKPEFTTSYEGGAEIRFLNDRLGLDFTYYNNTSKDLIIPVKVPVTSGSTDAYLNSGSIRNKGVEISVDGTAIKTKDFSWDVRLNYTRNSNKVLSIYPDLKEIVMGSDYGYLSSTVTQKYIPGMPVGSLYGRTYQRYYGSDTEDPSVMDDSRPLVIGANGFPILNPASKQQYIANSQPKWIGSLASTLRYKDLSLSFLFDTQQGVYRYNQFANFMASFALQKGSENRNDIIVFDGVLADGTPNTKAVWLGQGVGPDGVNYGNGYYRNIYRGASETFIEDASWFRLRTLSLGYTLPAKFVQRSGFLNGATVSLSGNNLWIDTKYSTFDPESSLTNSGSVTDGFSGFTYPGTRSYILSLNVNF